MKPEQERSESGLHSTHAQYGKSVLPVDQLKAELLNSLLKKRVLGVPLTIPGADDRFPKMSGY